MYGKKFLKNAKKARNYTKTSLLHIYRVFNDFDKKTC